MVIVHIDVKCLNELRWEGSIKIYKFQNVHNYKKVKRNSWVFRRSEKTYGQIAQY